MLALLPPLLAGGDRLEVLGIDAGDAVEKLREGHVEPLGDLGQVGKRDVAVADFDRGEVGTVHADLVGELLLADVGFGAKVLHPQAQFHLE